VNLSSHSPGHIMQVSVMVCDSSSPLCMHVKLQAAEYVAENS
jgi:hypothetical protein